MKVEHKVQAALQEDIDKIYEFAKGRYQDNRLNGPDIKTHWWQKNPYIFYVIHDRDNNVCANINLLPLKEECYNNLRDGYIAEKDISFKDIYTHYERDLVKHIYIEGFNCKLKSHAFVLLFSLADLLKPIMATRNEVTVGAIGGTEEGERIMSKLNFKIAASKEERAECKNFYEISYQDLIKSISSRTHTD